MAGIAAGVNVGVAKQAQVYAVKVLDCTGSGSTLSVIQGIFYAINNCSSSNCVISLSLGSVSVLINTPPKNNALTSLCREELVLVLRARSSRPTTQTYYPLWLLETPTQMLACTPQQAHDTLSPLVLLRIVTLVHHFPTTDLASISLLLAQVSGLPTRTSLQTPI